MGIRIKLTSDSDYVMVDSYHSLAMLAVLTGDPEESERYYRKEAEILKREGKEYPAFLFNFATILRKNGKFNSADSLFKRAIEITTKYYGEEHRFVANCIEGYALFKNEMGISDTALAMMNKVSVIRKKLFGEKSKEYTLTLNAIGRIYQSLNQNGKALDYFKEAIKIAYEIRDTILAEGDFMQNLAKSQFAAGEYLNSIKSWEVLLKSDIKSLGEKHPYVAEDIANIAKINSVMGNISKAEQLYRESINSSPSADAMLGLGSILAGKGETEAADTLLRKGLEILIKKRPEGHSEIAYAKELLGDNLIAQKKYAEAEKYLLESYTSLNNRFGSEDQNTIGVVKKLIKLYNEQGKFDKVHEMKAKLN